MTRTLTVCYKVRPCGAVAQLGERLNGIQEVDGSIPFGSTRLRPKLRFELRPGKPLPSNNAVSDGACHGVAEGEAGPIRIRQPRLRTTPWQVTAIQ